MTASHSTDGRLVLLGKAAPADADRARVGAKAANLMRLVDAGLPVPPAFVLTTEVCREYQRNGGHLAPEVDALLASGIGNVEQETGMQFGGDRRPLLVSVRSGAPVSMPGMLDTVLDVGLTDRSVAALVRATGDPTFAWDSYRRFVTAYGQTVDGCPAAPFDDALASALARHGVPDASELDVAALRALVAGFQDIYRAHTGHPFPQGPRDQLRAAVEAVLRSSSSPRAVEYRRVESLTDTGTAVTVQAMVFGNVGARSGAGVAFTRDPATGDNRLYADFLLDAQGEDIVAGRHSASDTARMIAAVPGLERQLEELRITLEAAFTDAQDFEFTVEEGRLWLLQSRTAKRTALAALQIACDLVSEGVIDTSTALERLRGYDLDRITRRHLADPGTEPLARATPAGGGVASGWIALDVASAMRRAALGDDVVLVREEASTDDVAGLAACRGVLTATGARTSHAAVVARQLGIACLVNCPGLAVDIEARRVRIGGQPLGEDDRVTIDGSTGAIYPGVLRWTEERPVELINAVRAWQRQLAPARP